MFGRLILLGVVTLIMDGCSVLMRFICIWERDVPVFFFSAGLGLVHIVWKAKLLSLGLCFRRSFMSPFCVHE
jgi:hypothetical protein